MAWRDSHISDRDLVMAFDGELEAYDLSRVETHVVGCRRCRARQMELERTLNEVIRAHRLRSDSRLEGRLVVPVIQAAASRTRGWAVAAAACGLAVIAIAGARFVSQRGGGLAIEVPNPGLTPGAAVPVSRSQVCGETRPKNKRAPAAMERQVLQEYGLRPSEALAYEVDYLITPALGGADDVHNLWPQSYRNTNWNARVKDDLEDHLRDLVCEGKVDLSTAQREIASNWIGAYKKYFHTNQPIRP